MLKIAAAIVVVFAALAVRPAAAAPRDSDCVNCAPAKQPDGSGSATAYTKAAQSMPPADNTPEPNPAEPNVTGAPAPSKECADCPPAKHYDEIEVIKHSRDVSMVSGGPASRASMSSGISSFCLFLRRPAA